MRESTSVEPAMGIDLHQLAGGDEAAQNGHGSAAAFAAKKHPVVTPTAIPRSDRSV